MNRITRIACLLLCLAWPGRGENAQEDRLIIGLFPHAPLSPDVDSSKVKPPLDARKSSLIKQLQGADKKNQMGGFAYLDSLEIREELNQVPDTEDKIAKRWENQYLELLVNGFISRIDPSRTEISSTIYFGKLKGVYPQSSIKVATTVAPANFDEYRDNYSIPMLYNLAMQARETHRRREVILEYLRLAREIANNLGWQNAPATSDKRKLSDAIEQEAQAEMAKGRTEAHP